VDKRIELWDLTRHALLEVLSTRGAGRRLMMDGDTIFLLGDKDILILQDAIAPGRGRRPQGEMSPAI